MLTLFTLLLKIWKEKYKDLWILFTNWGRIGAYDQGQHQNTPYGTAEQAIEEFEKIFKAKSGNEWANRDNFEEKPKKYRLVSLELTKHVKRAALKFDLESKVPSRLPKSVRDMVEDLTNVSMYMEEYRRLGSDIQSVPFGRIKREKVEKAKEILIELTRWIKDKRQIEYKRYTNSSEALQVRLFDCLEEIFRLSSEYYHLMPKKGFEYVRLSPIDNDQIHRQELDRVNYTLDLESAERLLLGAQYRKKEINPLDYIYRALGCKICPMAEGDSEVGPILQYMYNSREAAGENVEGIFKVCRPEKGSGDGNSQKVNRKLLWHGSKAANLLSILNGGLLVHAPFAPVTGKAFGDGLYTADIFGKSWNYTFDHRTASYSGSKYMLLCDVTMGKKMQCINNHRDWSNMRDSYPSRGYSSVMVSGNNVPDPLHTVKAQAGELEIPLGKIVPNPLTNTKKDFSPVVGYNEYIVYKDGLTTIRYIVKIRDEHAEKQRDKLRRMKFGIARLWPV